MRFWLSLEQKTQAWPLGGWASKKLDFSHFQRQAPETAKISFKSAIFEYFRLRAPETLKISLMTLIRLRWRWASAFSASFALGFEICGFPSAGLRDFRLLWRWA